MGVERVLGVLCLTLLQRCVLGAAQVDADAAEECVECRQPLAHLDGEAVDGVLGRDVAEVEEDAIAILRMSLLQTSLRVSRDHLPMISHAPLVAAGGKDPIAPVHAPETRAADEMASTRAPSAVAALARVEVPVDGVETESDIEEQRDSLPAAKFAVSDTMADKATAVPDSRVVMPEGVAAAARRATSQVSGERGGGFLSHVTATLKACGNSVVDWLDGRKSGTTPEVTLIERTSAASSVSARDRESLSSWLLASMFAPSRDKADVLPILLICMLAFLVGIVFLIQVVGWTLDEKPTYQGNAQRDRRFGAGLPSNMPRYARLGVKGSPATSPYPYASAPGTGYGAEGTPCGAFDPLPTDAGSLHGRTWASPSPAATPSLGGPAGSAAFLADDAYGRERGLMDRPTASSDPRRSVEVAQDALCPALILPHGEARFSILAQAMHSLGIGRYPVEILGPSGRPLLHARLPVQPAGGCSDHDVGRWLELTTTATSRYPHASVGPVQLRGPSRQALEIRGPKGNAYGMLEPHGGGWCARRAGRIVLRIATRPGGSGLEAFSMHSTLIASAIPEPGARLIIQVSPGVDPLLTLLCTLAVALMSPDFVGMSA